MMPVIKLLQKGNTRVISLLVLYKNRNNVKFKVLCSIVYFVLENFVCVDYLFCPETKLRVTCKGQGFENVTYNTV